MYIDIFINWMLRNIGKFLLVFDTIEKKKGQRMFDNTGVRTNALRATPGSKQHFILNIESFSHNSIDTASVYRRIVSKKSERIRLSNVSQTHLSIVQIHV